MTAIRTLAPPTLSDFASAVREELDRLAALPPNWDGYVAPVIDDTILAAAANLARELPADLIGPPRVVPLSSGALQFEWRRGQRVLELEFETATVLHFLRWDPENQIEDEDLFSVENLDRVVELIRWFLEGAPG